MAVKFLDPHDVPAILGTDGWEKMYPYQYHFSKDDPERAAYESGQIWYYEARTMETEKDAYVTELLNTFTEMINRHDTNELFIKLGRLLGLGRHTLIPRTDYRRFLLSSRWITSGVFTVGPRNYQALHIAKSERVSGYSAFFRHSLWTTAGVFTVQI